MANIDYPNGASKPTALIGQKVRAVAKVAAAEIFVGDPVLIGDDGTATRCSNGAVTTFDTWALTHALTGETVYVAADPYDCSVELQCDDNTVIVDVTEKTFDLVQAAGDATRLTSGCELDSSTGHATTGCVRVIDMVDRSDNDITLANNRVRVVKTIAAAAEAGA